MGDRTTNWMHVNAAGDLFLCCNDYSFDHKFASLKDNTLREVWATDKHVETIVHAFKTICSKCSSAKTA
jgi:radical SAM protein with 4Fe4S-binding SPASM domain